MLACHGHVTQPSRTSPSCNGPPACVQVSARARTAPPSRTSSTVAEPAVTATGGFAGYVPVPEIAARSSVVIVFGR